MIVDLTAVRDGTGPARLLDMVEGRSEQAFKSWLADRDEAWRDAVDVVAMDGFPAPRPLPSKRSPKRQRSWDPVHVVRLAGDALGRCRRRVQFAIHGRGMTNDPLYSAHGTLNTGAGLLTDREAVRLAALFSDDAHVDVEATWSIYRRMVAAYRRAAA